LDRSCDIAVFDIETDGLNATKIHCLVYERDGKFIALTDYDDMRNFLLNEKVLIGHNIILFDIPTLERLLGITIHCKLIDTLTISWYLEPDGVNKKEVHGLEAWGDYFGVPKPPIGDWQNLSVEEYIHRCTEDVKINTLLWQRFRKQLLELYGSHKEADKLLNYLSFKMDCAHEQERSRWKLDVPRAKNAEAELLSAKTEKLESLSRIMPKVAVKILRRYPSKPFKKDGTLSTTGARWQALLQRSGLGQDFRGVVEEIVGEKEPNPASPSQIKAWLYSLGWKPQTFKYKRDKATGETKKIPQVNLENNGGICPSVKLLYIRESNLQILDGLSVINHRLGLIQGFLTNEEDGYVKAQISGLTNTLRFKHKTVVNLPKITKPWGSIIRGCLICDDGYELCGSDMSSLEDRLKQHFIYPYDPKYVEEMNVPDYDPHLSLALLAKRVDEVQVSAYKSGKDQSIAPIRSIFKNGNYACQYGAGPPRLALTANISLKEAKMVWETYWEKNWAIKEVAKHQKVKTLDGQMWLYNPISNLWYSLRYEKDIFSTLVQGSAAYVFDRWVQIFRETRPQLTAQFHDEVVLTIRTGHRRQAECLLVESINKLNSELHLNRELAIGTQFGQRYSDIH